MTPPNHNPARTFKRERSVAAAVVVLALALGARACFAQTPPTDPRDDQRCLRCHGQQHITTLSPAERLSMVATPLEATAQPTKTESPTGTEPGQRPSLFIRADALGASIHKNLRCVDCHQDAISLPHASHLNRATCAASCHAAESTDYSGGAHKAALDRGDPLAPTCASCHGGHEILAISDRKANPNRLNSLHLCGECHEKHAPGVSNADPASHISNYLGSAHAKALTQSGLPMAATCADCHGAHGVLASREPASKVNRANIPATCGKCHVGVEEIYAKSVHGRKHAEQNGRAAVCTDCHTAHQITLASSPTFMRDVIGECGRCHDSPDATGDRVGTYYASYAESYHGQVNQLGTTRAARCSDCHGAHDIQELDQPTSKVAKANLITTCSRCHPGANEKFVQFDPHANHRDAKNYPILHGVWLYFMVMMTGVFTFFGAHTALWFFRARRERRRLAAPHHSAAPTAIRRFTTIDRINHAFVAITFFGLTATGIPLVFATHDWARTLASLVGGVEAAGLWHRCFAVLLIANFGLHFAALALKFARRSGTAREWLFGPASLIPRWKDARDIFGMFRWFFRGGPSPRFDRWTYWEKFDYWAEVGGSFIIGGSGLLLWFPEFASRVFPGWSFNVAMIVHGYEALLAIGFIFTIHFFNAHLRPGTFPVDPVIFTGSQPESELREQRPEEYERLIASGGLEALRVPAPDPARRPLIVVIAVVSVGFGLLLLGLIIVGGLT